MTSRNKRELDTVFDTRHELGEGIIWDEETEQLIWFDINNHQLFLGSPESRTYQQVQFDSASCSPPIGLDASVIHSLNEPGYKIGASNPARMRATKLMVAVTPEPQ